MAGLFSYVSGSAFVYQGEFGLDEQQFGLLFGAGAVWLIAATQLNPVLLRRWSPQQLLVAGTVAGAVAGAVLVRPRPTRTGGLWAVAGSLWAVLFACGLALPNAPALALSRHGEAAGTAAALLGAVQFGVGRARLPGRRPAGQRRRRDRHRRRHGAGARDRRPGGRRPAVGAARARRRRAARRRPLSPPVRLPATGSLVERRASSHDGRDMSHRRRSVACRRP